jgi:hypothetical protein
MIRLAWAFLSSKVGIAVAIGAAAATVILWLYVAGLRSENALLELQKANAEARIESLQRDINAGKAAETKANEIIRDLSATSAAADAKVREYAKELESRPDSRCALVDRDLEWLRNIGQ